METVKDMERASDAAPAVTGSIADGDGIPEDSRDSDESGASRRQTLPRMGFRVGELGLLFPLTAGREVIAPPLVSRIPNTVGWLRGLANVRGTLVPVIDAAAALGVTRNAEAPVYLLIFGSGQTAVGLLIDGLPRSLEIDVAASAIERPDVPWLLDDSVLAAFRHDDHIWLDVDLDVFFDTVARHVSPTGGNERSAERTIGELNGISELAEPRSAQ